MNPSKPAARGATGNPFTPIFGRRPPVLAGRDPELTGFSNAVAEGPGASGRLVVYSGPRGVGKTTLLGAFEDEALAHGWVVISEAADGAMTERLARMHLPQLASRRARRPVRLAAPAATEPGEAQVGRASTEELVSLVALMQRTLEGLRAQGRGVLITVDELDSAASLTELQAVVELLTRVEGDVAVLGAGLARSLEPSRRVRGPDRLAHIALGPVAIDAAHAALAGPIRDAGRKIKDDDLRRAVVATQGYPLMIQLVGHGIWRQHPARVRVGGDDVTTGIAAARRRLEQLVLEPTLRDLSGLDTTFLVAMAADDGPSRVAAIASRMGVDPKLAGQYRLRLLRRRVIVAAQHGSVDFALPALRAHVRRRAAAFGDAAVEPRAS